MSTPDLTTLSARLDAHATRLRAVEERLGLAETSDLSAALDGAHREIADLRRKLANAADGGVQAHQTLAEVRRKLDEVIAERDRLRDKAADQDTTLDAIAVALGPYRNSREKPGEAVTRLRADLDKGAATIASLRAELDALRAPAPGDEDLLRVEWDAKQAEAVRVGIVGGTIPFDEVKYDSDSLAVALAGIRAVRARLAALSGPVTAPPQEPVAWAVERDDGRPLFRDGDALEFEWLDTEDAARERVDELRSEGIAATARPLGYLGAPAAPRDSAADCPERLVNVDTALAIIAAPVVEFVLGDDWWQVGYTHSERGRGSIAARWRHRNARSWSGWGRWCDPGIARNIPARIVPQPEAEADPSTRGPIGEEP